MHKAFNEILGVHLPCFCTIEGSMPRLVTKLVRRDHFYYASYYDETIGIKEVIVSPKQVLPLELQDDMTLFLNPIVEEAVSNAIRNQYWVVGPYCWGRALSEDSAILQGLESYGDDDDEFTMTLYVVKPLATAYIGDLGTFYTYDDDLLDKKKITVTRKSNASKICRLVEKLEEQDVYWEIPNSELYDYEIVTPSQQAV
jgi:hypothetical protein